MTRVVIPEPADVMETIRHLRAELQSVLEREAATHARHDARVEALELEQNEAKSTLSFIATIIRKNIIDGPEPHTVTLPDGTVRSGPLADYMHTLLPMIATLAEQGYRPTLPAVQPAVHPAFDCRQWWNYVVPMPLTADDQGPATVGVDAAKMHYEVWDQDLVTHGSFDFLPDAINYAMALNYDLPAVQPAPVTVQTVLTNPLKDRGKMIKPFSGAPAGGYPLVPNPVDDSQGRETVSKPSVDLTPEAVARLDALAAIMDPPGARLAALATLMDAHDRVAFERYALKARLQAAEQLAADLRAAVTTYHLALDRRENGNSAGYRLQDEIQRILDMPWKQGAALAAWRSAQ